MVGRFVEQEQVGLLHEQPRQVRAHDPAAAHLFQLPIEIAVAERQPAQDRLGLRFELITAEFIEPRLHFMKIVRVGVVTGFEQLSGGAAIPRSRV